MHNPRASRPPWFTVAAALGLLCSPLAAQPPRINTDELPRLEAFSPELS